MADLTQGKDVLGFSLGPFFCQSEGPSKVLLYLWPAMHGYLFVLNGWLPLVPVKEGHASPCIY